MWSMVDQELSPWGYSDSGRLTWQRVYVNTAVASRFPTTSIAHTSTLFASKLEGRSHARLFWFVDTAHTDSSERLGKIFVRTIGHIDTGKAFNNAVTQELWKYGPDPAPNIRYSMKKKTDKGKSPGFHMSLRYRASDVPGARDSSLPKKKVKLKSDDNQWQIVPEPNHADIRDLAQFPKPPA